MSQNSDCCDCNDYSLLTANLGIATISTANALLTGAGSTTVFTAPGSFNGSIIKTIRIKATGPVTTGMIRLFIGNGSAFALYKEIPVPTIPVLNSTPTPTPVLPNFEVMVAGGLKLLSGFKLYATTQNAQAFNIITEGLNWKYPGTLPDSCCNYKQETATTGIGTVTTASAIVAIYTAPGSTNGSFIKTITIKALQPTSINGMIRLYVSPDGETYTLMNEIMVPETNQSGYEPSWKMVVDINMNINSGYYIGAASQLSESYAFTVDAIDWTYPIS